MLTTLTLDKDVAAIIERLRKTRRRSFDAVVNEVLREGLKQMTASRRRQRPFRTDSVDLGRGLIGNVDNVGEVPAVTGACLGQSRVAPPRNPGYARRPRSR